MSKSGKEPMCQLDCVFLGCTFGSFHQTLPSKHSAIQQVINCIWKHPEATVVYLTCDLLGQENILAEVSRTFNAKIYIDKAANPECFKTLIITAPQIISFDPSSRFHLLGGPPKLRERAAEKFAEAKAKSNPKPLIICASTQWYACEGDNESRNKRRYNEAVRDDFRIWHVCYSIHSSRDELEWALKLLSPKWVVSTTPGCRSVELDYVTGLTSWLSTDNPIWKLLSISLEASTEDGRNCEGPWRISTVFQEQQQPVNQSNYTSNILSLKKPSKRPAVTLFGRARQRVLDRKENFEFLGTIDNQVILEVKYENSEDEKSFEKVESCSSRTYSESLRKLYRTMNVPVPRPLPSLLELDSYNKQKEENPVLFLN